MLKADSFIFELTLFEFERIIYLTICRDKRWGPKLIHAIIMTHNKAKMFVIVDMTADKTKILQQ